MIAKLERTQNNAQQNMEQTKNPTTGATINIESTKQNRCFEQTAAKPLRGGGGWG